LSCGIKKLSGGFLRFPRADIVAFTVKYHAYLEQRLAAR
jgi:hypothetical protein